MDKTIKAFLREITFTKNQKLTPFPRLSLFLCVISRFKVYDSVCLTVWTSLRALNFVNILGLPCNIYMLLTITKARSLFIMKCVAFILLLQRQPKVNRSLRQLKKIVLHLNDVTSFET